MKIKDITNKPRTEQQIKNDQEYHEYPTFAPALNFDDSMTLCSFDQEDMKKKIRSLNDLDED
jgi:hypothetical protein